MGRKCKKKTQWKQLSLVTDDIQTNTPGEDVEGDDEDKDYNSLSQRSFHRPAWRTKVAWQQQDQDDYQPNYNNERHRGHDGMYPPKGGKPWYNHDRPPHFNKVYGRPYNDSRFSGRHFQDEQKRYKIYGGHNGFYIRGPPPLHNGGMLRRRWSHDDEEPLNMTEEMTESMEDQQQHQQQHIINNNEDCDDSSNMFTNDPGAPPLAGVVMQQVFPGGPLYTIPVHWTPFIEPGLIPGDTALTPLDPAFTTVLDSELMVDPSQVLPIQHDASGCPVTVQVQVDENGMPVQIEPSVLTLNLGSIYQQQNLMSEAKHSEESVPENPHAEDSEDCTEMETQPEDRKDYVEAETVKADCEDNASDSQYASMSESSTAPNSPAGELTDLSEGSSASEESVTTPGLHTHLTAIKEDKCVSEEESLCTKDEDLSDTDKSSLCNESECNSAKDSDDIVICENENVDEKASAKYKLKSEVSIDSAIDVKENTSCNVISNDDDVLKESKDNEDEIIIESISNSDTHSEEVIGSDLLTIDATEGSLNKISNESSDIDNKITNVDASQPNETDNTDENPLDIQISSDNANSVENQKSSDNTNSIENQSSSDNTNSVENQTSSDNTNSVENQTSSDTNSNSKTSDENQSSPTEKEQVLSTKSGYVMVPILTPYYDPSVIYGYPYMMTDSPPADHSIHNLGPQDHNYKKKKKKCNKRYQNDGQSKPYLDPEHYTGEPYMTTYDGYMVPMEPLQICHVHGMHYVSANFPHMPVDEGFVSVDHSPFITESVADPCTRGSIDETDKSGKIFSDLQETEKRQIKEILHQERTKGKGDSTDQSDSGVSESEEAVATESSSDEIEVRDQINSQTCSNDECYEASMNTSQSVDTESKYEDQIGLPESSLPLEVETVSHTEISSEYNENNSNNKLASINDDTNIEESTSTRTESISSNESCKKKTNKKSSKKQIDVSVKPKVKKNKQYKKVEIEKESIRKDKNIDVSSSVEASQRSALTCDNYSCKEDVEELPPVSMCKNTDKNQTKFLGSTRNSQIKDEKRIPPLYDFTQDTGTFIDDELTSVKVTSSLKDLKLTEAVKRWIREVTPEKAFTIPDNVQSLLIAQQIIHGQLDTNYSTSDEEISEKENNATEPKNGLGNPFIVSSSSDLDINDKRVASILTNPDDCDSLSTISSLSHSHLYSDSSISLPVSSCQSFDYDDHINDPSIYDPSTYAKYYQLGVDVDEVTPVASPCSSYFNSREATPSASGSEEIDIFPHKLYDGNLGDNHAISLAAELIKAEKIECNMGHITGQSCNKKELSSPCCGEPCGINSVYSNGKPLQQYCNKNNGIPLSPSASSGLGSSIASTPTNSPARPATHEAPRLAAHPLKNLSNGEGPVPCRTACCAVM